ncbi:MAG: hypothetical protein Q8P67_24345 [archaeon]|nr:hypothetical protein [archaeon]
MSLFSEQLPIPELDKSNTLLWTPDRGSCMAASSSAAEIQTELDSSRFANFSHKDSVFCVAMHPTLPVCASGGGDDVAFLWDYQAKTRCQLSKHTDSVADISFSPDGKYVQQTNDICFSLSLFHFHSHIS